jgi:uncharacterized protein YndB with AHSA1/START domain
MPSAPAQLEEIDGRPALRFERVLSHPPERVWRALTEPEEMGTWHPTPARFEPRAGGRAEFVDGGYAAFEQDGEVLAYDPPTLLAYTWGKEEGERPDELRFELRLHDDGCLLTLVHVFDDRFKAARDGAGWHVCLDSLAAHLEGHDDPPAHDPDLPGPWERLNSEYQERFGISPEEATPPPQR